MDSLKSRLVIFIISTFCFNLIYSQSTRRIELDEKLNDVNIKSDKKLILFRDYIIETLYENPYIAFTDLSDYLNFSIENRDSIRIAHAYHCLGFYARQIKDFKLAKEYVNKEYEISLFNKNNYYIINSLVDFGVNYEEQGNYELAEKKYIQAIQLAKKKNEPTILARAKINLGNLYRLSGNFQKSLFELEDAKHLCEERNIVGFLASVYFNLGDINTTIEENKKAKYYYDKALEWSAKRNNNNTKIQTFISIIRMYLENESHFKKSRYYFEQLKITLVKFNNPKYQTIYHSLFANYLIQTKQIDEAEIEAQLGLNSANKNSPEKTEILNILGEIYSIKNNNKLALKYLNQAYSELKKTTNINLLRSNCYLLYTTHKKLTHYSLSLKYLEEYNKVNDQIINTTQVKLILKKQLENDYLNKQKIAKSQNDNKLNLIKLKHKKDVKIQQNFIFSLTIILFITFFSTYFIYKTYLKNKKQKTELERLNKLNKQIFSIISHDFNTPLISLNSLIKKIEDFQLDKQNLNEISIDLKQQIIRTNSLLSNLLNWSRAELDENNKQQFITNIKQNVDEIINNFSTQIIEKELKIINSLPLDLTLKINPDLLKIIFRNIITNAIKYSYHADEIQLKYDQNNKSILLIDEGIGIEKTIVQNLLKKPVYSKNGTSNEMGFGIGLYICAELLRKINWNIRIESEGFDKGTTIILQHC